MPKYSNSSGGGGGGSGTYYTDLRVTADTEDVVVGSNLVTWFAPVAMTIVGVAAWVGTAPTGSGITVDINDGGTSIMTTNKLTIDATEASSYTAATAAAVTDTAIAANSPIFIDVDAVGSTTPGKGLVVRIVWTEA